MAIENFIYRVTNIELRKIVWKITSIGFCIFKENLSNSMIKLYKESHDVDIMVWVFFSEEKQFDLVKLSQSLIVKKIGDLLNVYIEV